MNNKKTLPIHVKKAIDDSNCNYDSFNLNRSTVSKLSKGHGGTVNSLCELADELGVEVTLTKN